MCATAARAAAEEYSRDRLRRLLCDRIVSSQSSS
jgi:hypothetical protein